MSEVNCPACGGRHPTEALAQHLYICPACGVHLYMPARARIALLADPKSFKERDRGLVSVDPLRFTDRRTYRERLLEAQRSTGLREAVVIGGARIEANPVVLVVFDFAFMAGTMGSVVGEKIADAFEYATRRRIPLISIAASGGARMQEGMLSLMQMAKTAAAQAAHARAGLAHISVLTNPTFGGVTASFASLGDVIIAEPGAQVGFVGPQVIEMTLGTTLPPDSHRAETLLRAGMIDLIVPRPQLRTTVAYLVDHLKQRGTRSRGSARLIPKWPTPPSGRPSPQGWQAVQLARHVDRPTAVDYITRLFTRFIEFHGDRYFGDDPAIICGIGDLEERAVMVVAQERGRTVEEQAHHRRGMAYPEGYRKALRVMQLAAKFHLPLLTLVDTPGAALGVEAEQRGIAHAIARNLQTMAGLATPVVSVVIGEGGSGGALSLAVADRVLMLEHAIYSVMSPEGAAAILWRDPDEAARVADALKITAGDLLRLGVIDGIVPEPPGGAHLDPDLAARLLHDALLHTLAELRPTSPAVLVQRRYRKYRHIGRVGVYWREVARTEIHELLEALEKRILRREHERTRQDATTPSARGLISNRINGESSEAQKIWRARRESNPRPEG